MRRRTQVLTLGALALLVSSGLAWWRGWSDISGATEARVDADAAMAVVTLESAAPEVGPSATALTAAPESQAIGSHSSPPPLAEQGALTLSIARTEPFQFDWCRGQLLVALPRAGGKPALLEDGQRRALSAGDWLLLAGPGHGNRAPWQTPVTIRPGEHLEVRVDTPDARTLGVIVEDAWGEPVQQHEIALSYAWPHPLPEGPTWESVETDAVAVSRGGHRTRILYDCQRVTLTRRASLDGGTWFEGQPDGPVTLRVECGPCGVVERRLDRWEGEVRVTLPVPAVSLRVRFPPPPVDLGWLAAARPVGGGDLAWRHEMTGTVLLRGLAPGDYDVWILGRAGLRRRVTLTGGVPPEIGFTGDPASDRRPNLAGGEDLPEGFGEVVLQTRFEGEDGSTWPGQVELWWGRVRTPLLYGLWVGGVRRIEPLPADQDLTLRIVREGWVPVDLPVRLASGERRRLPPVTLVRG